MNYLTYNDTNMLTTTQERRALVPELRRAYRAMEQLRVSGEQGFFDLPFDSSIVKKLTPIVQRLQKQFDQLLVIGIGGSDLGARTLYQAVGGSKMRLRFLSNTDPDSLQILLDQTDWKRTAVNVVSKSGTTLETTVLFEIIRQHVQKQLGKSAHAKHIVATTQTSDASALYQLAKREGYAVVEHPTNVGGRFSVLSSVGLFPTMCSGTDVRRLLVGARWMEQHRRETKEKSIPARFTTHHIAHMQAGRDIHVVMPYAESLFPFAMWFRQLWGESLGKKKNGVCVGPTPIAAFGPADQHSQIQLYNEGPDNKVITFILPDRFKRDIRIKGYPSTSSIQRALCQGTAAALTYHNRPNGTLHIPSVSPESVGALLMMYETATAYMAQLLGVNAFDQPGVEKGKAEARRILEGVSSV